MADQRQAAARGREFLRVHRHECACADRGGATASAALSGGIGGNIGYGGNLPIPLLKGVFPFGWPAIAAGAVFGILVNLLFLAWKPPRVRSTDVLE